MTSLGRPLGISASWKNSSDARGGKPSSNETKNLAPRRCALREREFPGTGDSQTDVDTAGRSDRRSVTGTGSLFGPQ